jgi:peptidyl-prolyl cis-trans isomerase A (cyclophilin A)
MRKYAVPFILALGIAALPLNAQFPAVPLSAPGTAGIAQPINQGAVTGVGVDRSSSATTGAATTGAAATGAGTTGVTGTIDRTVLRPDVTQGQQTKPGAATTSRDGATSTTAPSADPVVTTAARTTDAATTAPKLVPGPEATGPGLYATLVTTMGAIRFKLFENETPQTVRNFVDLCLGRKQWRDPDTHQLTRKPLIPGTTFHRVIPGFMIQAGDPTGTGRGDVGFVTPDEFRQDLVFDRPGRVAMAHAGPGTAASQFFITEAEASWLNGKYTVFGQVVEGQEVVNAIARTPRGSEDKPNTPVKIVKVTFQREGPAPPNAPEGAPAAKKAAAPAQKVGAATPAAAPATKQAAPSAPKPVTKK